MDQAKSIRRRGILAAAAVALAGIAAKNMTETVEADGTALIIGAQNSSTGQTQLNNTVTTAAYPVFYVDGYGVALGGHIQRSSTVASSAAVQAINESSAANAHGVAATADTPGSNGIGVLGIGDLVGVAGNILSTSGSGFPPLAVQGHNFSSIQSSTGVQGLIDSSANNAIGVEGRNNSLGATGGPNSGSIGVLGTIGVNADSSTACGGLNLSTAPMTYGMSGQSYGSNGAGIIGANYSSGVGLQGQSTSGHGLTGVSNATDGIHSGVFAYANAAGAIAFQASGVAGSSAGLFRGDVTINGNLVVNGSFNQKSAALPHPDGTSRLLFCAEAPEPWFEDFGEAKIVNGAAQVTIDPDFAVFADMSAYHVFITEYEGNSNLYVTKRAPTGFEVRAKAATTHGAPTANAQPVDQATVSGTISWRIVAKRKDYKGSRFARFTVPKEAQPPTIHDLPVPPQYEELQRKALAAIKK